MSTIKESKTKKGAKSTKTDTKAKTTKKQAEKKTTKRKYTKKAVAAADNEVMKNETPQVIETTTPEAIKEEIPATEAPVATFENTPLPMEEIMKEENGDSAEPELLEEISEKVEELEGEERQPEDEQLPDGEEQLSDGEEQQSEDEQLPDDEPNTVEETKLEDGLNTVEDEAMDAAINLDAQKLSKTDEVIDQPDYDDHPMEYKQVAPQKKNKVSKFLHWLTGGSWNGFSY